MQRGGDFAGSPLPEIRNRVRADSNTFLLDSKKTVEIPNSDKSQKLSNELWFLHGEYYDLTDFIGSHPGGSAILKLTKGMEDATPVMESYHAFANKDYINRTLAKYKVSYLPKDAETRLKPRTKYTFENDGFYATLTRKVRAHFGGTKDNESVASRIKADKWWTFKVVVQTALFTGLFGSAFFMPNLSKPESMGLAATAGMMLIAVGMNAMHDASHYAIGTRDSWKNRITMRIWNAIAWWQPDLWLLHHTIYHHAFTGDPNLDPDTMHANPAVRKHIESPRNDYFTFIPGMVKASRLFWTAWATTIYVIFPGMFSMQIFSYNIKWPLMGTLWNMPYQKTKNAFRKFWFETFLSLGVLGAHLYKGDIFTTLAFFLGANLTYALCIVPDHDCYETVVNNHKVAKEMDWGEVQVRNASDFGGQGLLGRGFTEMFGSINVQIAHHLFPSVNHVYLPELAPIIEETCKEFEIPYTRQPSIAAAIWSFMKTVYRCMGPEGDLDVCVEPQNRE